MTPRRLDHNDLRAFRFGRLTDEHPGIEIPWHAVLSEETSNALLKDLGEGLGAGDGTYLPAIDPDGPDFLLNEFLRKHGISPKDHIYLNYFEGPLMQMRFADVAKHFYHLFWAGPDDLQMFDETLRWSVFIDHDGRVHVRTC